MDHFWTGPDSTPDPVKRRNEGFWPFPGLEVVRIPTQNGPKMGHLGVWNSFKRVLNRFDSLLRARAKVYSIYDSDPKSPGRDPILDPFRAGSRAGPDPQMAKIPHFAVWILQGSGIPVPDLVQKCPKMDHFGGSQILLKGIKSLRFPITRAREGI